MIYNVIFLFWLIYVLTRNGDECHKMVEDKKIDGFHVKCMEEAKSSKKFGFGIRHVQMICICQCMIALFIARSSLGIAILAMTDPDRKNDTNVEIYDWDKRTQGIILSSFFWGYMTMQIPAGLLAKKYGGKLILLVALLANGVVCLALPFVASYGGWMMVCACRVVMGLTQACLFPASHTLLGRWLPSSERTALTGLVYGGTNLGTIIAMPVSGLLAETAIGWKLIFYSISGLMMVTACFWYWFAASSPGEHRMISEEERDYIEMELNTGHHAKQNRPTPWGDLFRTVPLWAILVTHMGCAIAFTLFFVDLPTYLERAMQISLKNSAILSALPYFGMWLGSVGSSYICEKIYNRGLLSVVACRKLFNSIALFGAGIGCVGLAFMTADQKNMVVALLVLILTMIGFTSAGFMVNHLDLSPHFGGVMLSLTNFGAGGMGGIVTPVVTSYILRNDPTDVSRWRIVFLLVAGIVTASNVFYLIFGSADRQPWDSQEYSDRRRATIEEMKPLKTLKKLQQKHEEAIK